MKFSLHFYHSATRSLGRILVYICHYSLTQHNVADHTVFYSCHYSLTQYNVADHTVFYSCHYSLTQHNVADHTVFCSCHYSLTDYIVTEHPVYLQVSPFTRRLDSRYNRYQNYVTGQITGYHVLISRAKSTYSLLHKFWAVFVSPNLLTNRSQVARDLNDRYKIPLVQGIRMNRTETALPIRLH